jgi:hypothetical protein
VAVTVTLLNNCRTALAGRPELTAYQTARDAYGAGSDAARPALWYAAFGDNQANLSPAYRLKVAIRETIAQQADATVTPAERETAYRQLVSEYVQDVPKPTSRTDEQADLVAAINEDLLA